MLALNVGKHTIGITLAQAIVIFSVGLAQAENSDPLKCDFSGIESPMITVKIENADLTGAELKVPRDYLMSRAIDGATRDALLLQVWKDSFLPYTMRDARSEDQSKKYREGRADNLLILISSLKDLDSIAKFRLQFGGYPSVDDQDESRPQPVAGQLITLKNGLSGYRNEFGLLQQEILPRPRAYELLLADNNEEITDVMDCDQIGDVPFPGCDQIFEYSAYDIQISYRRKDLPKWREFKEKTEKLLACLTTKQLKER